MASKNSLLDTLFTTRTPLYFNTSKRGSELRASEQPSSSRSYFECGKVQAPRFGDRAIYVEDIGNRTKNDQRCTEVLTSVFNLLRTHVQKDQKKLKLFYHPDNKLIHEPEKMKSHLEDIGTFSTLTGISAMLTAGVQAKVAALTFAAMKTIGLSVATAVKAESMATMGTAAAGLVGSVLAPIAIPWTVMRIYTRHYEGTYFDTSTEHQYRLRPHPWVYLSSSKSDDVLCGNVPNPLKNSSSNNVYVAKGGDSLCPELLEFVKFSETAQAESEVFPKFTKTFQGTREV